MNTEKLAAEPQQCNYYKQQGIQRVESTR